MEFDTVQVVRCKNLRVSSVIGTHTNLRTVLATAVCCCVRQRGGLGIRGGRMTVLVVIPS